MSVFVVLQLPQFRCSTLVRESTARVAYAVFTARPARLGAGVHSTGVTSLPLTQTLTQADESSLSRNRAMVICSAERH